MTNTPDIVEVMAAEVARETLGWTPDFKPKAVWPDDYMASEITTYRAAATAALRALDAAGWALIRKPAPLTSVSATQKASPHPTTGEGE